MATGSVAALDLDNELTKLGDKLLTPLNGIRNAVVALAGAQVKDFIDSTGGTPIGQEAWASSNQGSWPLETPPGESALTRTPRGPQYAARKRDRAMTAAFEAG